ncbi:Polyketide synthase PksJ [Methylobrevis pamukkalensis]|uniref:Polyketide synthase PksJ n=1 Tax=Methylobrevis pamukkalensis TaxID=1439726 RepID=A0A1E3H7A8_9HYPH|nr:Polyketide synthase PksJ [Methylobrevis pamukkalensis]
MPIRHDSLSGFLRSMIHRPGLAAGDRLLAVTTVAFDIAALELFGPLVVGGTVILADAATVRDGGRLAALAADAGATVMQATPAGWRLLVEAGWPGGPEFRIFCGGEALGTDLARELLARGREVWNLYGPTETAIWSAALKVEAAHLAGSTVPVGGAIDGTQIRVVDPRGMPVPLGVPGELAIGGVGLSPGYRRKPALTAEKFVPDPCGGITGAVLYRTGDRVRLRGDGTIAFLGRLDGQVKLRGHRIETGEIEARLAAHPGIAQAVVVASGEGASARLVAGLRWREGVTPSTPDELRAHLAGSLPAYMLPAAYVPVPAFPLTPNGKIDRRALALAVGREPVARPAADLRLGEPAAAIAAVWCEVLGLGQVALSDNFFDLGGHSLLAMAVQRRLNERLGLTLDVVDIFRFPTLETLAGRAAGLMTGRAEAAAADTAQATGRAASIVAGRERLAGRRLARSTTAPR